MISESDISSACYCYCHLSNSVAPGDSDIHCLDKTRQTSACCMKHYGSELFKLHGDSRLRHSNLHNISFWSAT